MHYYQGKRALETRRSFPYIYPVLILSHLLTFRVFEVLDRILSLSYFLLAFLTFHHGIIRIQGICAVVACPKVVCAADCEWADIHTRNRHCRCTTTKYTTGWRYGLFILYLERANLSRLLTGFSRCIFGWSASIASLSG
jgi:hypothetical protein